MHFRRDFFLEAKKYEPRSDCSPKKQSDLMSYCIGYLRTKADESRQQYHDWQEKDKATNENVHLFSDVKSKVVAF